MYSVFKYKNRITKPVELVLSREEKDEEKDE
jgi:hypothetical protein